MAPPSERPPSSTIGPRARRANGRIRQAVATHHGEGQGRCRIPRRTPRRTDWSPLYAFCCSWVQAEQAESRCCASPSFRCRYQTRTANPSRLIPPRMAHQGSEGGIVFRTPDRLGRDRSRAVSEHHGVSGSGRPRIAVSCSQRCAAVFGVSRCCLHSPRVWRETAVLTLLRDLGLSGALPAGVRAPRVSAPSRELAAGGGDVAPAREANRGRHARAIEHLLERGDRVARRSSNMPVGLYGIRFTLNDFGSSTSTSSLACAGESLTPFSITYSMNTFRARSAT